MKRIVFIVAAFLLSVSCSDDRMDYSGSQDVSMIRVSVESFRYSTPSGTRSQAGNVPDFKWTAGDTVGIFAGTGAQLGLPMPEGREAAGRFDFDGGAWALKAAASYSAYYPFQGDMYLERNGIPVCFTGQAQRGNGSTAHLVPYDYMVSGSAQPQDGRLSLDLQHLGAMLELRIGTPEPLALQMVEISADADVFVLSGKSDPADPAAGITPVATASSIRVDLQEVRTSEDDLTAVVYCMVAPFDCSGRSLNIKVVDVSGNAQDMEVSGDVFRAGSVHVLSVGMEDRTFDGTVCRVKEPGTLSGMIDVAEKFSISSLEVSGNLNGSDIRFIREMAGVDAEGKRTEGRLKRLDMKEARIVGGGGCYLEEYSTEDNVIGTKMFYDSRLERIVLPGGIGRIEEYGLAFSEDLVSVGIPSTVREIGQSAFMECYSLESVSLPQDLVSIGDRAFYGCPYLESLSFPAGLRNLGARSFAGCSALNDLVLPSGLESVGYGAFRACGLRNLVLPAGLESIGGSAFASCTDLTSVAIPASVVEMGNGVFSGCVGLVSADLSLCGINELGSDMFNGCERLVNVLLPKGLIHIWNQAFGYCTSLKDIVLPDGLEEINWEAFYQCTALEKIEIPGSVTGLDRSFVGCSGLKQVVIKNGSLTKFSGGSLSFLEGVDLEEIRLPASIKQVDSGILNACVSLKALYCFAEEPPYLYENNNFNPSCRIYVPKGSVEKYKADETWRSRADFISAIPDGVSND